MTPPPKSRSRAGGKTPIVDKAALQHLTKAIGVVGIPPELVREHCGKGATELSPAEYRDAFEWLLESAAKKSGWTADEMEAEMRAQVGGLKAAADLTPAQFTTLVEKMADEPNLDPPKETSDEIDV